ncbi:unnamed protein product [Trichogramma brassicae]|uniref:Uncharacterized protein n=1 Tax=Trichogramma brassicae TaxID=86971 RepID=A0A6H5IMD0_9HYME|nr:unnamed protein product [Trichogramma brassicae]
MYARSSSATSQSSSLRQRIAVIAALVSVVCARPGGLTGHILDHGLGHIHAPNVVSHDHGHHVAVIAQPVSHAHHVSLHHAAPLIHPSRADRVASSSRPRRAAPSGRRPSRGPSSSRAHPASPAAGAPRARGAHRDQDGAARTRPLPARPSRASSSWLALGPNAPRAEKKVGDTFCKKSRRESMCLLFFFFLNQRWTVAFF